MKTRTPLLYRSFKTLFCETHVGEALVAFQAGLACRSCIFDSIDVNDKRGQKLYVNAFEKLLNRRSRRA